MAYPGKVSMGTRKDAVLDIGGDRRQPFPAAEAGGRFAGVEEPAGDEPVACPECGAFLTIADARCPYCGALNPVGAEKAYMASLDGIKDETGKLADNAIGRILASLRKNTARTVAVAVVAALALAGLLFIPGYLDKQDEQQALRDFQAREAFRTAHFQEFDRLYEAGDFDALSAYIWSLSDDPGFDALFSWSHVGLLEAHDDWEALRSVTGDIGPDSLTLDDYTWLTSVAFRLAQLDGDAESRQATLSAEDKELTTEYRAYARQLLRDTLQMDDSQIASFADDVRDDQGYLDRGKLRQALDSHLRRIGTLP